MFSELQEYVQEHTTGILPSQTIQELVGAGHVFASNSISPEQIQPASLDLRLGTVAYRIQASFLPSGESTVMDKVASFAPIEIDLSVPKVLERGCVYIVPLMEELRLPEEMSATANPKSSTGRLDVFTRLITDNSSTFERVGEGYKGRLYAEVVPRTFSIVARAGDRLNQLRFRRGSPQPHKSDLERLHDKQILVYLQDESPAEAMIWGESLGLSVDLNGDSTSDLIGYRARKNTVPIDLRKIGYYDPTDYWEPVSKTTSRRLILDPTDFHILTSKERVRIPPGFAAEMVPYDPLFGEFRIHYAGFFDPGFGYGADDIKGTHAVLEVRSHEVPFLLEDGQVVGRLVFERLLSAPSKIYGQGIGSSYQHQRLALSKHFRRG